MARKLSNGHQLLIAVAPPVDQLASGSAARCSGDGSDELPPSKATAYMGDHFYNGTAGSFHAMI